MSSDFAAPVAKSKPAKKPMLNPADLQRGPNNRPPGSSRLQSGISQASGVSGASQGLNGASGVSAATTRATRNPGSAGPGERNTNYGALAGNTPSPPRSGMMGIAQDDRYHDNESLDRQSVINNMLELDPELAAGFREEGSQMSTNKPFVY